MENALAIFLGVLGNWFTELFKTVLLPFYKDWIYTGWRVDGAWQINVNPIAEDQQGFDQLWQMTVYLKQKNHRITGTAHGIYSNPSSEDETAKNQVSSHVVEGHIYDGFVSLTFRSAQPTKVAYATYLLQNGSNGEALEGYRNFYGTRLKKIRAVACTLSKV